MQFRLIERTPLREVTPPRRAPGRTSPIGAGASHEFAHLHATEFGEKISGTPFNDPIPGRIASEGVVRRNQPCLAVVGRDGSFERVIDFNQVAKSPLGLRRDSTCFPILDRTLRHANRERQL
jgi:hypothetical protein